MWRTDHDEPEAVVTRAARFGWDITIRHGLIQYGPDGGSWYRWTRGGAARKAARELARYRRRLEQREQFVVT